MKILMLNPFFYPYQGGTEKHILEVGERLVKRGFEVTVLTTLLQDTVPRETINGIDVRRVNALMVMQKLPPFSPVPPPIALAPLMSNAIKETAKDFDWVHINNRFFYSPTDAKNVKKLGKKLAITLHNARTKGISPATDFFGQLYDETNGRQIMKQCDAIAAVSKNTLDITVPKEYQSKGRVVYNGVNLDAFNPSVSGEKMKKELDCDGKKLIVTVCRLTEQKGLRYLLAAMKEVAAIRKDAHLAILGVGSQEEELRKITSKLGLESKVTFINRKIPEGDLSALYAACDVFVLPSLWEPFGMVICEAMATCKPVVGTAIGGIPEIITPDCGFLVKPKDSEDLAEKLLWLLDDEKKAREMGIAGRKRVEQNFTWDRTADGYEKMYGETR